LAQQIKYASGQIRFRLEHQSQLVEFYQKGAWALLCYDTIGFSKKAVRLFEKYAFQNVTTENFFDEVRKVLIMTWTDSAKSGLSHQSLTIIQLMFY
jgi:aminopeptidase N